MRATVVLLSLVAVLACLASAQPNWRPVVLMHGLMASAEAMSHAQGWIEANFSGIYVKNVEIGNGREDSLFMNINTQVADFAAQVAADPLLANGFNIIGHSQGGMIIRAYVERFNSPPVYNMISWAGPYDGVYGAPDFNALCPDVECPWLAALFDKVMYGPLDFYIQNFLTFATYWKDPLNVTEYLENNIFLADINNEREIKNANYKNNILSLNKVLLIKSTTDDIVVPRTSPWFEFYKNNSDSIIVPWNESESYLGDWIGMKTLNETGRLILESVPCHHVDIPRAVCIDWYNKFTYPLLNNTI